MLESGWYQCAYCGESIEASADRGQPSGTSYVEDCEVCCRPNRLTVRFHADGSAEFWAEREA